MWERLQQRAKARGQGFRQQGPSVRPRADGPASRGVEPVHHTRIGPRADHQGEQGAVAFGQVDVLDPAARQRGKQARGIVGHTELPGEEVFGARRHVVHGTRGAAGVQSQFGESPVERSITADDGDDVGRT